MARPGGGSRSQGLLRAPGLGPAGRPGSLIARLLIPASILYAAVAAARRRRISARAFRLPRPVVSVGNITCGGTGKTPVVEMVARDLLRMGMRPAILSRGYGARGTAPSEGVEARDPLRAGQTASDELLLLAANLPDVPHYVGRDRRATGMEAVRRGADVIVLDDGFQHVRLHRDLDIVLIDAIVPFGGGWTLPSGLLREPLDALSLAGILAITRSDQVPPAALAILDSYLARRFPHAPRAMLRTEAVEWTRLCGGSEPPDALRGKRVLAFCGIGNPESFRRQLLALGVNVLDLIPFHDHHPYTPADLTAIEARAASLGAEAVALTQKDAVKITPPGPGAAWLWLRIAQRVARGEAAYRRALDSALGGAS